MALMLCRAPYQKGNALYPCGQCQPCRINRRRVWTHRIVLEALLHEGNAFITLTYDDDKIPQTVEGLSTLRSEDAQLWLKRLRREIEPAKVRFYLVGEYGDQTWRPHYHAALFGYPGCEYGVTRHIERCCDHCELVKSSWGMGHVTVGHLSIKSAAYVAGYVTKKLTMRDDPRLQGRDPEFARMSLKPGIGGDSMWDVASEILAFGLDRKGDVPAQLRHGARLMPLGRYLRRRLRTYVGKPPEAPAETVAEVAEELQPLWESTAGIQNRGALFKTLAVNASEGEAAAMVNRATIWKRRARI